MWFTSFLQSWQGQFYSSENSAHILLSCIIDRVDFHPALKTSMEGGMQASAHLTPFSSVFQTGSACILPSQIERKVGWRPALTSHPILLWCKQGSCSQPTFKVKNEGEIFGSTHLPPSSTVLWRGVWLISWIQDQKEWWDAIQKSPHTLVYCSVEKGVACILPSKLKGRWDASQHPPHTPIYCILDKGLSHNPPSIPGGLVGSNWALKPW